MKDLRSNRSIDSRGKTDAVCRRMPYAMLSERRSAENVLSQATRPVIVRAEAIPL